LIIDRLNRLTDNLNYLFIADTLAECRFGCPCAYNGWGNGTICQADSVLFRKIEATK